MAVRTGLLFDLDAWRKGVRRASGLVKSGLNAGVLRPWDRAVLTSTNKMKGLFAGAFGYIKNMATGAVAPLLGIFAAGAAVNRMKALLMGSLEAWRGYTDSVTILDAALRKIDGVDLSGARAEVLALGEKIRLSMGITQTETNRAVSDLLTRGFDLRQAEQLAILAANYAKKSGKPLADVTKAVADAANGSVDAMKELGVQIELSGNKVKDARAAVLAMKAAYGDIGSELANPSDRLAAAWERLEVTLGQGVAPILEPMIQSMADLVTGLTSTEDGVESLQKVGRGIGWVVDLLDRAAMATENFLGTLKKLGFANLADFSMKLSTLASWAGAEEFAADFKTMESESMRKIAEINRDLKRRPVRDAMRETAAAGRQIREQATGQLQQQMAATRTETFAGAPAVEEERRKVAEENRKRTEQMRAEQEGRGRAPRVVTEFTLRGSGADLTQRLHSVPVVRSR
jgi:hypothetical protein